MVRPWNYLMLAPAQKAFWTLLRRRMTLTSLDASCDRTAEERLARISCESALKSEGLLR